jgi:hypothetical protein
VFSNVLVSQCDVFSNYLQKIFSEIARRRKNEIIY